jgi:hypothetical protein
VLGGTEGPLLGAHRVIKGKVPDSRGFVRHYWKLTHHYQGPDSSGGEATLYEPALVFSQDRISLQF